MLANVVRLVVLNVGGAAVLSLDAPAGERVLDLLDEHGSPIPLSCRAANCGTCRVELREGAELVVAPSPAERLVLAGASGRLACQLRLLPQGQHAVSAKLTLQLVAPAPEP